MQTKTIYTPPRLLLKTSVIAVVGTTQELCAPEQDGWFLAEFFLWYHFVAALTPHSTFLTCVNINEALRQHSYVFGNPGQQDSRTVMNPEMYRVLRESSNTLHDNGSAELTETELADNFQRTLIVKLQTLKPEVNKVLVLIFAHGSESRPMRFLLGNKFLSLQEILNVFKDYPTNVEVEFVTTSLISGGWTSFTLAEALKHSPHEEVLDLRWLASTFNPLRYVDGQLDKKDLKHILSLLRGQEHQLHVCGKGAERYRLNESEYTYFTYGDRLEDEIRSRSSLHGIEHDLEFATFCTNVNRLLDDIALQIIRNNLEDGNCLLLLDRDSAEHEINWMAHVWTLKAIYSGLPKFSFSSWYAENRWLEPGPDESRDKDFSKTWVRLCQQGKPVPIHVANRALLILQGLAWNKSPEDIISLANKRSLSSPFMLPGPYTHRKLMQFALQIFNYRGRLEYFAVNNHMKPQSFDPEMCRQIHAVSGPEAYFRDPKDLGIDGREIPLKSVASLCGHHFDKVFRFIDTREHDDDKSDILAVSLSWYFSNYLRRAFHRNGVTFDYEKNRWMGFYVDPIAQSSFRCCENLFIKQPVYWYLDKHNLLSLARESPVWKRLSDMLLNEMTPKDVRPEKELPSHDSEEPDPTQHSANLLADNWTVGNMSQDSCPEGEENLAHNDISANDSVEKEKEENPDNSEDRQETVLPESEFDEQLPEDFEPEEIEHPVTWSESDSGSDEEPTRPPSNTGDGTRWGLALATATEEYESAMGRLYTRGTDRKLISELLKTDTTKLEYYMFRLRKRLPDLSQTVPMTEIFRVLTTIAKSMRQDNVI